ncbi:MAG: cyclic lactone autoinducer peptide [Clostridia bacterium]|nr:cyclic lactone autoinducer peptide [Clostridia bacterium]
MLKLLAKLAEKYAKFSTSECLVYYFHEPKMPTSLLK